MRKTSSTLIAIVVLLLALGIVMLASASSVRGLASVDDPHFFLKKQLVWLFLSLVLGAVIAFFDYHWWQKLALPLSIAAVFLLAVVLIPGIGTIAGGSRRWLYFGPLSLQPSEMGKFATIIGLVSWTIYVGRRIEEFKEGVLFPFAGLGVILLLMISEPDFGTTLLTGMVGMLILFVAGTRLRYLFGVGLLGGCGFMCAVMINPVRRDRVLAFLMPEKFPATAYHLAQSKIAFIKGGLFGVGLGNSMQKQFYLPEAHNDFILAIIGEELGFLGTVSVVMLFVGILVCGIIISMKAPDPLGRFLAFGMTMMITLQAAINMGVVTGCLPTKGLPLPFISYGGSSLMASVASVGVLVNIALHSEGVQVDDHTRLIRDKRHRF
jgi:cell division protein FtsW